MDFVEKVLKFNEIAGNDGEMNPRKFCMYCGLILEEMGEVLESFNSEEWNGTVQYFNDMSTRFKRGDYDSYATDSNFDKVAALDGCIDVAVVALGTAKALGADVDGACHAVADNNLSKFNYNVQTGEYIVLRDENGKVKKPANFVSVDLTKFV